MQFWCRWCNFFGSVHIRLFLLSFGSTTYIKITDIQTKFRTVYDIWTPKFFHFSKNRVLAKNLFCSLFMFLIKVFCGFYLFKKSWLIALTIFIVFFSLGKIIASVFLIYPKNFINLHSKDVLSPLFPRLSCFIFFFRKIRWLMHFSISAKKYLLFLSRPYITYICL